MLDHSDQDETLGLALRAARPVALTRQATTAEAQALDAAVCELIEANENRKYNRGVDAREALLSAVTAFLGALLSVDHDEWIRHSTDRGAFTGGPVSYRNFAAAWGGMEMAGLIERKTGHAHLHTSFGIPHVVQRYETRFRATPALWTLANSKGVDGARGHYEQVKDVGRSAVDPVALRGFAEWVSGRGKVDGATIEFDKAALRVQGVVSDVERLNTFWQDHTLTGGVHRGFTRIFHTDGTSAEGYGWDLGGRLYSVGAGNYQTMKEEDRAHIRIDGEAVAELDVQASYLTVFMAQARDPLDVYSEDDPYQTGPLAAFPRGTVKAYIAMTFGRGEPPTRWGQEAAAAVACPIEEVARAVRAVYPALARLKDPRIWAKLMYSESQAVLRALLDLAGQGIPALPVHDSIIVPVSKVAKARDALRAGYYMEVRAEPRIMDSPHRVQVPDTDGDPWEAF